MDLETVMLSEVRQRKAYTISHHLTCRILKQMIQMNLFTKQKQIHRLENEFMVTTRGYEWGEGIIREFGVDMYTLLYLK